MHSHSVSSDDSRATVEQYVKWVQVLRKRGHTVDGIVLTEHRKFDFDKDYSALADQYNLLVFKGSELDTRYGHFLVYGVTQALTQEIDFSDVGMDARALMQAARRHDAIALPAHPGRFGIGLTEYIAKGESFEDVEIVERLNGGSRQGENERAEDAQAAEQLLPLVYDELRKLAARKMAQESAGQTRQATALVHDAYIRLVDAEAIVRSSISVRSCGSLLVLSSRLPMLWPTH